jgi:transglutaminase-like putative cysteine protease
MKHKFTNPMYLGIAMSLAALMCLIAANVQGQTSSPSHIGPIYRNPRVYNVEYSVELSPDPNTIDRSRDLKLWVPIPREWDSQKAVKILSVQPEPQARYVDPEYGNPMLFWDFGKMPEQATYTANIRFRLESYDIDVEVDPARVGPYDKMNKEYALYTQSTRTIHITPKIKELAQEAVGDETNPYLQAQRIIKFVYKKMHFKVLDYERGRGIDVLLAYPVVDEKTGQEYYEGCCTQYAALMVALCRAVGIPARCVADYNGWVPWIQRDDAKARHAFETNLSPDGLAATQLYGDLGSHMWAEFFIPNYGWIPSDPMRGTIGDKNYPRWITSKGRDVLLGPDTPREDGEGYGAHWVALHDGRADNLGGRPIFNIAKIHTGKVKVVHHSDPFPADGLAGYPENPPTSEDAERDLRHWRQRVLGWPSCTRSSELENLNLDAFYKDYPQAKGDREAFVCHMLRRQLGDEKFLTLVSRYIELRQKSGQAVPTSRFQELAEDISGQSLGWFFNQWLNSTDLPRLKLENVTATKDNEGWQVQGRLMQSGDKTFRLPIEIALDTKKGRDEQKLWVEKKATAFEFRTPHKPQKLVVDPDYEILKVQKMSPRLWWFDSLDPEYIVIYGTLGEAQANEIIADQFVRVELGYDREIVKADTDVNDADLKTKCVFLIGRPETNRIAQQFKDSFPIKFDGARFTWQGITYDKPTQRLHQIIENPNCAQGLMIMYAGLSPETTLKMRELESYDSDSSYVIFDGDRQLLTGDWEDVDGNLFWSRDTHSTVQREPNQQRTASRDQ